MAGQLKAWPFLVYGVLSHHRRSESLLAGGM
jgi:hypothetical protein